MAFLRLPQLACTRKHCVPAFPGCCCPPPSTSFGLCRLMEYEIKKLTNENKEGLHSGLPAASRSGLVPEEDSGVEDEGKSSDAEKVREDIWYAGDCYLAEGSEDKYGSAEEEGGEAREGAGAE